MISATALWFVACVICVGIEIVTGTLYMLAAAAGTLCAGMAAFCGLMPSAQGMIAGIVTLLAAASFYFLRRSRPQPDGDDCLDAGQQVMVRELLDDGSATVMYRGARWQARAEQGELAPGPYTIARISGSQLILRRDPGR